MKSRLAVLLLLAAALRSGASPPIALPIYIEDNHAGSFYWLAEHLDLDEEYTLVHFDAHSDASQVFDSDEVRERLRRVGSLDERRQLLERWRAAGAIQCFNWIEPLMPAPISRVIWVHDASNAERREALEQVDGHLEAAPRAAGSFRKLYEVVGFDRLRSRLKENGPVIVTIDLDYFAKMRANRRAAEFERVWKFVTECRNLRAVTIAISRPYLKNDQQADDLLRLALEASLSLPTATIQFEPFKRVGNDRSLRAREFQKRREEVPAFKLANASEGLRAVFLANRERISVASENAAWEMQVAAWEKEASSARLVIKDHDPSTDNVWRIPIDEDAEVELETDGVIQRIEWIALTPEYRRCNLTATRADELGFARGAPPRPRWRETELPGKDRTLAIAKKVGAMRVKTRIEIDGHIRETAPIEIRRFDSDGFRAAITEQFALPYLFGSGELNNGVNTGPETGWGADCANFLIYALRRQGLRVPWSNPKQLRDHLEPVADRVSLEKLPNFTADDLRRGLVLHLGTHVAALVEDRPPASVLNAEDVVAHQLEGPPALITVDELLRARQVTRFDLLRVPPPAGASTLIIGGDVMLGRTVGEQIKAGVDPFAGIRAVINQASNSVVNLECVVSEQGLPVRGRRFHFRAPFTAAAALARAGINVVGVANNHADDFGPEAQRDASRILRAANLKVIGDDEMVGRVVCGDVRVSLVALNDSGSEPTDRSSLAATLTKAREDTDFVIALVHWGEENRAIVTERQRTLARWLIDHGVDLIAGSHPHCLQPLDFYHGRAIVYSLGNLVFDGAPTVPAWNTSQLLEVGFSGRRQSPAIRLIPVELDANGFPHLTVPGLISAAERKAPGR